MRTTDRIEALVFVAGCRGVAARRPITAAVGTAVYDSSRHIYAEQAHTRHTVTATVTDVPATQQILRTGTTTVSARWIAAGAEHTGAVETQSTTKTGDTIEIWVDNTGAQVPAPTPTTRAAVEAAMGALVMWICVAAIAATLFTATRAVCDRIRFTRMATRPRQLGRQRRRPSVSRPHVGTVTPLMAPRNHPPSIQRMRGCSHDPLQPQTRSRQRPRAI